MPSTIGKYSRSKLDQIIDDATSGLSVTASPAGSDTQLQYNDGGRSTGGVSTLTYNDSTGHLTVIDDKKLYFGSGNDSYVQYNNSSNNYLEISGSGNGVIISGSTVYVDSYLGIGVAPASVTHAITLPDTAGAAGRVKANAYLTYSSIRYKENIKPIKDPIGLLSGIEGITFSWRENKKSDFGFIAEEVGKRIPNIVEWDKTHESAFSMDYTRIIPILVEGIKEQQLQIDKLKTEIKALKRITET
jgi:hypothetical protein